MPRSTARSRLPHAGDPIRSSIDAIAVVSLVIHRPLEAETIAFFLDEAGRSNTITVVSGTTEPDSVLTVAECMAAGRVPTARTVRRRAGQRSADSRTQPARDLARRRRPLGRGQRDHRDARDRAGRVVRHRAGRRRLPARAARRAGAMVSVMAALRRCGLGAPPGSAAARRRATGAAVPDSTSAARRRRPCRRSTPRERRSDRPETHGAGSLPVRRTRAARRSSHR